MEPLDYVNAWVQEIKPYAPGKTVEGAIKLASNENNYGPSPHVIEGLKREIPAIFKYPYKKIHLKEKIAEYAGVKPESIVLGNGSDEIIELLFKTFGGPVASHYPTFVEYPTYSQIYNRRYISSNLNADYTFSAERFIEDTREASLLFLCTPNNPVGTLIDRDEIIKVAETGKITVVDEAYFEFCGKTAIDLVETYPNLIVLRTLSKAFGLAGLRVGYAVADPRIAEAVIKVKAPFNVNYIALEAGLLALEDIPYMQETVQKILKDREKLEAKLGEKFRPVESHTNFVLVDVSPYGSMEFYEKLAAQNIIIRPQPPYAGFEGNYVRITIGTTEENDRLIEALDKITSDMNP